jgi:lipoprotein-anchoring transpeptidase ErfK/SrfK
MKTMGQSGWVLAATVGIAASMQAAAQQSTATVQSESSTTAKRVIVVSLEDRKLALVVDGRVKETYTVAVGKASTPSPEGTFTIERRVMNPTYYHDGLVIPPGKGNPVGTRWIGLSIPGYGIHGTNVPTSIGKAASHGCIRMGRADLEKLFAEVEVGDTVELIGTRNEETAQFFGDGSTTAPPAPQRVMTAENHPAPAATAVAGSM